MLCKNAACNDGDLRLEGGSSLREGRVEICYDNVYSTVCDDQWGLLDAQVACRNLGFSDAGMYIDWFAYVYFMSLKCISVTDAAHILFTCHVTLE